jgi:uncharacterized protein (TIGR02597 family)
MKLSRLLPISLIALSSASVAVAQTATTDPVGFVTTTIRGSTSPGIFAVTPISPALLALSDVDGLTAGSVTDRSANSITIADAGWTAGQLASSQAYVLFQSGSLEGLILQVTSNTSSAVTLNTLGADLTSLGAQVGDTVKLIQGDTILSMFGTPDDGVVGGSQSQFTAGQTDRIVTRDAAGVTRTFYFNTDSQQWRRVGSTVNQGNTPISPLAGVFYYRIGATPISQVTTGSVPVTAVKFLVPQSGLTYLSRFYPTEGTISNYGFQNLSGWRASNQPGVTIATADKVVTTDASGVIRQFYWNGTQWLRAGSGVNQGNTPVTIGGAVYVSRSGDPGAPAQLLSVPLPYEL